MDNLKSRRALADNLWTKGASHVESAKELAHSAIAHARERNAPDEEAVAFTGTHSVSIHLLIGYGFELLLKAAFVHFGGERKRLQGELRHDLTAILTAAEAVGFESRVENLSWILANLRAPHLQNEFRYGESAEVSMPSFSITFPALDALLREVGAHVVPDWPLQKDSILLPKC